MGPMRIAGIVVLSLAAGLFAVWFFLLRAPPPEALCDHMIEMAIRETGDRSPDATAALVDSLRLHCTKEKRNKLRLRGKYAYAEHAKCLMAARTLAEAEGC